MAFVLLSFSNSRGFLVCSTCVLISGTKHEHLSFNWTSVHFLWVAYIDVIWGVVFMHHCCKNGTIFKMLHKCHSFFSMIEDISVSLCFKNSDLVAKWLINILKCLSKAPPCESHPPLPSTYIYTNTQKWFFKGWQTVAVVQIYAWQTLFFGYNCGAGAGQLNF